MTEGLKPYAEYKESGQTWLVGIPSHWELKPGHAAFAKRKESNLGMKEKTVLSFSYGRIKVKAIDKHHGLVPESYETRNRRSAAILGHKRPFASHKTQYCCGRNSSLSGHSCQVDSCRE